MPKVNKRIFFIFVSVTCNTHSLIKKIFLSFHFLPLRFTTAGRERKKEKKNQQPIQYIKTEQKRY